MADEEEAPNDALVAVEMDVEEKLRLQSVLLKHREMRWEFSMPRNEGRQFSFALEGQRWQER